MYNIMIRRLCLFALMLLLCGCAPKDGVEYELSESSYQTELSDVAVQYLRFKNLRDSAFEEELNTIVSSDTDGALVSFDTLASSSSDKLRMGNRCVFKLTQDVVYNANDFVSVIEEHYVYTGGAHGNSRRYPRNIDLAQSCTVTLADLFEGDYVDTLNRLINEQLDAQPELYTELWEQPCVIDNHQRDFYIKENKLVLFFQPYELSYYAKGYIEFPLRLTDLSGYLKEEYRRLVPT